MEPMGCARCSRPASQAKPGCLEVIPQGMAIAPGARVSSHGPGSPPRGQLGEDALCPVVAIGNPLLLVFLLD